MRSKLALLSAVSIFAASACWPFDGDRPLTEMTVQRMAGEVRVLRGDETIEVRDETALRTRDVVVSEGGDSEARLRLQGDRVVQMDQNTRLRILDEASVESQEGTLVAEVNDPTTVSFGDVEARASDAVFRIDRGFAATRTGTYAGVVGLSAPGQSRLDIERLFQTSIAANNLRGMVPYRIQEDDRWDLERLDSVIKLDQDLKELTNGLAAQLGSSRPNMPYFNALAGRRVPFVRPFLKRSPGDLLTAFAIADNAAGSKLKKGFLKSFEYRDQGGAWGVVAALLEAPAKPLVAQLDEAILATGVGARQGSGGAEFTVAAAQAAATGTSPAVTGAPGPGGGEGPSGGGGDGPGGGTGGSDRKKKDEPPEECADDDLQCQIENELPDIGSSPSPSPSPTGILP